MPNMSSAKQTGNTSGLAYIDLAYDHSSSDRSVKELVYNVQPKWREAPEHIKVIQFKEGITNTLLKVAYHAPGLQADQTDRESVLMRAYGNNTEILIDRDREATSHLTCAKNGLAPPLLARFQNGLLYRYIPGDVCTAEDLTQERIWRAVARRLGQWHAKLPVKSLTANGDLPNGNGHISQTQHTSQTPLTISARKPTPNIWAVMRRWVNALPQESSKEQSRKAFLQGELERSFKELDSPEGPGEDGFVFGHCDLLSANVIKTSDPNSDQQEVAFIDYEYAVPCAAAFDIANHFAEWGGYDCDYNMLPTKSIRRSFLRDYLSSYNAQSDKPLSDSTLEFLEREVDAYRGMPGLYWGIWALIQATISQIDFNYAEYAEIRLGEYSAWREEENGSRAEKDVEMPLRERRWAES